MLAEESPLITFRNMHVRVPVVSGVLTAAALLLAANGWAQTAKPTPTPTPQAPAPVSDEPAATTASFGDWLVRCERTGEGDKAIRICEAAQTIQLQGQSAPIAQIGIGRPSTGEPLHVTIILPPNIALPGNVHFATDDKDDPGVDLNWRRCLPGRCVAEAKLDPETVKSWRGHTAGKFSYTDASGRVLAIPFSFRGLAQSLDALAKETH
jgi:invasion protein IalB